MAPFGYQNKWTHNTPAVWLGIFHLFSLIIVHLRIGPVISCAFQRKLLYFREDAIFQKYIICLYSTGKTNKNIYLLSLSNLQRGIHERFMASLLSILPNSTNKFL